MLALVPYVNIPVVIWLGFKGREMAWRNRHWDNIDHFNRVQRVWSQWGLGIAAAIVVFLMTCNPTVDQSPDDASESVVQEPATQSVLAVS